MFTDIKKMFEICYSLSWRGHHHPTQKSLFFLVEEIKRSWRVSAMYIDSIDDFEAKKRYLAREMGLRAHRHCPWKSL